MDGCHSRTWSEADRLAVVESYGLVGAPVYDELESLVGLTAELLDVPIAAITAVTASGEWLVAERGCEQRDLPVGLCARAVAAGEALELRDIGGAADAPGAGTAVRFYACELLLTAQGVPLGALCVMDTVPRPDGLTPFQRRILRNFAGQVMTLLDLRRSIQEQRAQVEQAREAAVALSESEARLLALADSVPQIVWQANESGLVDFVSRRWSEYTGRPTEEALIDQGWLNFVHPDDVAATVALWIAVQVQGREFRHRYRYRNAAGDYHWLLVVCCPYRDQTTGRVVRWYGGLVDIDAEQRAQEAAEQKIEQRTHERDQVWDCSPDMLCTVTFDGVFVDANRAWEKPFGWTVEELRGTRVMDYMHPDDRLRILDILNNMVEGIPAFGMEYRYRRRDGSYLWMAASCVRRGQLVYGNVRDISAARAQAEEQNRLEEQLRHAHKMEAVGQLTGGIAHDFNNLLASITGGLELAERHLGNGRGGDAMRLVATARGAAERAASLTHRLLAFSRRQTLDPRPTAANRLLLAMQDLIVRTVGPAVEVTVDAAPELWLTLCDPSQLDNALLNLAINARDAMPNGGRLSLSTTNVVVPAERAAALDIAPGCYVCVSVADTGTGMEASVVARAFDPFFTTKPIGEGTGLGLSMIYGFARQSGGQAWIDTELGRGTTISLFLPRHDGVVEPEPVPVPVARATDAVSGPLVMLVDDDQILRGVLAEMLIEAGYQVMQACDGHAAMVLIGDGSRPGVLVTDLGLPGGMNGRAVAEAVKAVMPGLPVLFITGYDEHATAGGVSLAPGAQVLTKPFGSAALLDRLGMMLPC